MKHRFQQNSEQDVFTDLLFNTLLGFAFMFAIAFMLISTPEKTGDIGKAEVLITIRWADEHPDDVDALVEDPRGWVGVVPQPRQRPDASGSGRPRGLC